MSENVLPQWMQEVIETGLACSPVPGDEYNKVCAKFTSLLEQWDKAERRMSLEDQEHTDLRRHLIDLNQQNFVSKHELAAAKAEIERVKLALAMADDGWHYEAKRANDEQQARTTAEASAEGLARQLAAAHHKLSLADVYLAKMRESWEAANQMVREALAASAGEEKDEG